VPVYEFRCRTCGDTFTEQRPMIASGDPAACPSGHGDTVRLLGLAGALVGGRSRSGSEQPRGGATAGAGGGCCGGGCCG
jgi:putative FmdB family regulatory protein